MLPGGCITSCDGAHDERRIERAGVKRGRDIGRGWKSRLERPALTGGRAVQVEAEKSDGTSFKDHSPPICETFRFFPSLHKGFLRSLMKGHETICPEFVSMSWVKG
jgi:hypothetical protein